MAENAGFRYDLLIILLTAFASGTLGSIAALWVHRRNTHLENLKTRREDYREVNQRLQRFIFEVQALALGASNERREWIPIPPPTTPSNMETHECERRRGVAEQLVAKANVLDDAWGALLSEAALFASPRVNNLLEYYGSRVYVAISEIQFGAEIHLRTGRDWWDDAERGYDFFIRKRGLEPLTRALRADLE